MSPVPSSISSALKGDEHMGGDQSLVGTAQGAGYTAGYTDVARRGLIWARNQDYTGYNKFDGNDSPIARALSFGWRPLELVWSQAVARFPVNIRPLLLIPRRPNPKGFALFARAWLDLAAGPGAQPGDSAEARRLLDWLLANPSDHSLLSWGYLNRWVGPVFVADAGFPNAVVSAFVCQALIHAARALADPTYGEAAIRAERFFDTSLPKLVDTPEELAVSYIPDDVRYEIVNVNAQYAGVLCRLYQICPEPRYRRTAERLLTHVARLQTADGAWYYAHPAERHPTKHDNYHTANVLEGFLDYRHVFGDDRFDRVLARGAGFYADHLFTSDGKAKWRHDREYPLDAHAAASGIIYFTSADGGSDALRTLRDRVAMVALRLFGREDGRFIYQRGRCLSRSFTLMRWSQAWLSRAFAWAGAE